MNILTNRFGNISTLNTLQTTESGDLSCKKDIKTDNISTKSFTCTNVKGIVIFDSDDNLTNNAWGSTTVPLDSSYYRMTVKLGNTQDNFASNIIKFNNMMIYNSNENIEQFNSGFKIQKRGLYKVMCTMCANIKSSFGIFSLGILLNRKAYDLNNSLFFKSTAEIGDGETEFITFYSTGIMSLAINDTIEPSYEITVKDNKTTGLYPIKSFTFTISQIS
jgi:hypothetical protein